MWRRRKDHYFLFVSHPPLSSPRLFASCVFGREGKVIIPHIFPTFPTLFFTTGKLTEVPVLNFVCACCVKVIFSPPLSRTLQLPSSHSDEYISGFGDAFLFKKNLQDCVMVIDLTRQQPNQLMTDVNSGCEICPTVHKCAEQIYSWRHPQPVCCLLCMKTYSRGGCLL